MAEKLTATQFQDTTGTQDWRYLLNRLEATFRAGSFEAAAAFATRVAEAAEAANHHPDLDIRYPDRVHVVLSTHSAGGVTQNDLELARTITALAELGGATSEPLAAQTLEIAIDALDIPAVLPFWQAVMAYKRDGDDAIVDPVGIGPTIWFQQMDEPRPQRNRIHLDITVPHELADQRVADAIAAGGKLVSDTRAKAFWILSDAEGNEVCVCTCLDRD